MKSSPEWIRRVVISLRTNYILVSPGQPDMELTMSDEEGPVTSKSGKKDLLTGPPFYLPEFETSYRYIIDEYEVAPRDIAIFMPCAVRKPYSASPSHRIIRKIIADVFEPTDYHIVIFGTCGILPAELEEMYPYAHYKYMLGKCKDEKVQADFLRIETERVKGYLEKTRKCIQIPDFIQYRGFS